MATFYDVLTQPAACLTVNNKIGVTTIFGTTITVLWSPYGFNLSAVFVIIFRCTSAWDLLSVQNCDCDWYLLKIQINMIMRGKLKVVHQRKCYNHSHWKYVVHQYWSSTYCWKCLFESESKIFTVCTQYNWKKITTKQTNKKTHGVFLWFFPAIIFAKMNFQN